MADRVSPPRQTGPRRFEGTALISVDDAQTVYVELVPSEFPGVLKELAMSIRFAPVEGCWLPSRFLMTIRVKVSVLMTLAERILTIEDRYSGCRLNPGLHDSVFEQQ